MKESEFIEWLKPKLPGRFHKIHGSVYQDSGLPDLIGLWAGLFVGIECKVGLNKVTTRQENELMQIALNGGLAFEFCHKGDKLWITSYSLTESKEVLKSSEQLPVTTVSRKKLQEIFMLQALGTVNRWFEQLRPTKT